jgi:transcriptional regulator with XRE-family HTH domain
LRVFRLETKLSQVAFAQALGIGSSRLASYEHGRVPIRYALAKRIGERFGVNLAWLADGVGPMTPYDPMHIDLECKIPPDCLLSEGYDKALKPLVERDLSGRAALTKLGGKTGYTVPLGVPAEQYMEYQTVGGVREVVRGLPPELRRAFFHALGAAVREFVREHQVRVQGIFGSFPVKTEGERKLLTQPSTSEKVSFVKSQLDNLLAGLDRIIKQPGKKTELAEFLGAPLASVSRWLSGKREPGREITLKMLRWVEYQERQQNTLGSATNTTKGKTQVRKSRYEKQTQVRRKR